MTEWIDLGINRSDGRVDRASASGSVDLGFDSESGQTNRGGLTVRGALG